MKIIEFNPIGRIHTPYRELKGMPIQPPEAEGIDGTVEVFSEYSDGLKDIAGFSHVFLLFFSI